MNATCMVLTSSGLLLTAHALSQTAPAAQPKQDQVQTNPLLGNWAYKSGEDCLQKLTFAPKRQATLWHGSWSAAPVGSYVVRTHSVLVRGKAGVIDDFVWTVVDKDTISKTDASGPCVYKRN